MARRVLSVGVLMVRWPLLLPFAILVAAQPAWALQPGKHRDLAETACAGVGLPAAFCHRMGKAAFETDYREWTDLSAHAQRELGDDRCTAADAALARVDRLAREAVAKTRAGDFEAGAVALGRAVHTLQDECAHHGMTNQEHAYYSLTQACTDADVSPDVQPAAIACADTRTREAFALVAPALAGTRWDYVDSICQDFENRDTCGTASLPAPWTACAFLAEHADWDGADSRWNGELVGTSLMSGFAAALAGEPAERSVCAGDASAIDPMPARPTVADRDAGCMLIDFACLGKVDDDKPADESSSGGCTSGRQTGTAMLIVLGLVLAPLRRRVRSRATR